MTNFRVKTESLAVRCEICHQADLFEPVTGVCARCAGIRPQLYEETIPPPARRPVSRFRYTGTNPLTKTDTFRNIFLGGLAGSLPGMVLPGFLVLLADGGRPIERLEVMGVLSTVCVGFSFIPGCISGFLIGRRIRASVEFQSIREFQKFVGRISLLSTFFLLLVAFLFSTFYQMSKNHASPGDAFLGVFCAGLLPASYFPLFNSLGGLLIATLLKFLDRNNIEDLRE